MDEKIENAIDCILKRLCADGIGDGLGASVNLTYYADDATLQALRPNETWKGGASDHRAAMEYAAAVVRRKYPRARVNLVRLELGEYRRWLDERGMDDSETARAEYASERGESEARRG